MTVVGDLLRAEWDARRKAYVVLIALFAATSCTYALVLALVGGLEQRIGGELSDNLAGDVRVSQGSQGVADGELIDGYADQMTRLRHAAPGTRAAARLEIEGLFLHGATFTTGRSDLPGVSRSAGILVGIDPAAEAGIVDPRTYRSRGATLLDDLPAYETPSGARLVPIVVGEQFLNTTDVKVANGTFSWDAVYNVTAGRVENNNLVTMQCIVVGSYATGFRMIDRAIVYAPRGNVARLVGEHPGDPPANVILVRSPDPGAVVRAAEEGGLTAITALDFRQTYLGPVFTTVRIVAWSIVGALTLMTAGWFAHTLSHHVTADKRKIATLRAIGIPREAFTRLYVGVGVGLGLVGAVVGLAAAALLAALIYLVTGLPAVLGGRPFLPDLDPQEGLALVAIGVLSSALAAAMAVRRVRRQSIKDALHAP